MKYKHNIPSYSDLQSSLGTIRRYMESRSCDVSKYVGLLVQIEKYLQVVHADESHQRTIDSIKDSSQLLIFINVKICILLKIVIL